MEEKFYNLTNPQKNIWTMEQFYKGTNINNICGSVIIKQNIDLSLLNKSINLFIQNNKSFGLNFKEKNGEVVQYFTEYKEIEFEKVNLKDEKEVKELTQKTTDFIFNLQDKKLYKFILFKLENGYGGFIISTHHIISDAATLGLLTTEIIENYTKIIENKKIEFKDYSYENYINDEKEYMNSNKFLKDEEYWNNIYSTIPEIAYMANTKNKKNNLSGKSQRINYIIKKDLLEKITEFCKQNNVSNFNFFMAIYAIYLGRISNSNDFVIGTPILNRTNFNEKHTTGMFINTAPLRIKIESNIKFVDFIKSIAQNSLGMLRHQKYPYENLLTNLRKTQKDLPTLFDTMLSYQVTKANDRNLKIPYEIEWFPVSTIQNGMYIHLHDNNDENNLTVSYDYQIQKYNKTDIENIHKRILHIISQVLKNNNILEKNIEIITLEEKNKIINRFNDTFVEYPYNKTIVDLFENQVEKTPNNIAVVYENEKLTFKELNEKANQLAICLQNKGITENCIVGILLKRSVNMIVAILAVLKSGGCYIPIDPDYPKDRIEYMLNDSKCKLLLSTKKIYEKSKFNIEYIDLEDKNIYKNNNKNLNLKINQESLSYIIYTSGSTGKPKGVMLKHKGLSNLVNYCNNYIKYLKDNKYRTIISVTTVSFDIFFFESIISLQKGLKLIIATQEQQTIPELLKELIQKEKAEIIQTTPSRMKLLLDNLKNIEEISNLKYITLAGEQYPENLAEDLRKIKDITLYNGYGPSETTVFSTLTDVTNVKKMTIGKPLDNTQIYILDNNMNICPIETPGEIYISGDGVGNGYINNEKLTNASFLENKFNNNSLLYKTGDLGYFNNDGTITCLGRADNQVKIRGLRIELEEIEKAICSTPEIKDCVVAKKQNENGHEFLCAYYTENKNIENSKIRNVLQKKLTNYMIPQYFVKMDKLPYTPNGKIDRKKLPEPKIENIKKEIIKPRNITDSKLIEILKDLLNINLVSIDDSFFELGGDSLHAINLSIKIKEKFNVQIFSKDILENPIIQDLSDMISTKNDITEENNIEIEKIPEAEFYMISSAQKRIYFSSQVAENSSTLYNVPGAIIVNGDIDPTKLEKCLNTLISRHESLRTFFEINNGDIVQKIEKNINFKLEIENMTNFRDLENIFRTFIKPFDFNKAPLFRAKLLKFKNKKSVILLDMHHIISDGTSLSILTNELSDLYNDKNLKKPKITYKDFAKFENEQFKSEFFKEAQNYWVNQFKDDIPVLELPTNYVRPSVQSFEGDEIFTTLSKDLTNKIFKICKKNNVTPFMLLISIYYILLSIYSRTEDIIIGSPISGRYNEQLLNIVGMFVNTLALRNKVDNNLSFKEFINNVKEQVLTSFEYQNYPLDELIKKLNIKRNISRNPLFDVLFIYQNNGYPKMKLGETDAEYYIPKSNTSKFDLSLEVIPNEDSLNLRFEYCTKLFTKEFIQNLSEHYINILKNIIENFDIKIADIDILSTKEKNKILKEFNNTYTDYPRDKSVIQLFEEQVEKNKNKTALFFENTKLTYNELNKKSNQIANYILENYNIKSQDVIGIFLDKSIESILAILGIIKAGCVFVPIDTEYPLERINYILEDSKAKLILTKKEYKDSLNIEIPKVCIDLNNSIYNNKNYENLNNTSKPDDLIYMMYTSGSTGKPKGVMIKHQNVVRLVKNTNYINFSKDERILQTGSIVFDACTFEIWGSFLNGGTLYLIKKENMLEQNYFEKYLKDNKITSIFLTTALFNQYCEASPTIFENLKNLLTGGETVSTKHMGLALRNFPKLNLVHVYGPTENTTFSTYHIVKEIKDNTIPIGKAIANSTTYVVSKTEKLLPIGVPGELVVGGDGVGNGYLNREDLTKEKFIKNPFGKGTIYKTGDLVKQLPNGDIEFIGRIDNQVKIRGFRIELNEIDNVIHNYPYITKTYTIIKDIDDKKYIVTYFTANRTLNTSDVTLYLQEKLPFYMVPQFLIQLKEFPLTVNGKIDKNRLPTPELTVLNEYIPPENNVQKQLCDIWCKLFEMKKVSILDNFFELGGDSLTAIKFQTEALKLDININYSDIFEYPTIKALSEKKQEEQLYKVDKNYDYSNINKILEINTLENIETQTQEIECKNLLLCGATGFLGAHILDSYLSNTDGNIYCLVRKKENVDSIIRLKNILNFYFENKYDNYFGNRINVVYGDITLDNFGLDDKEYKKLGNIVDIIINSAALVKHFGNFKTFQSINVIGTQNIIKFCKTFNKKLYHISTMSVGGISTPDEKINNDQERILFNETNFYINQNLNNAYVYTKFEAEKAIFNEIPNGLQACILRMGNISNRVSDGKFQINLSENAFINRIKSLLNIKVIQNRFLNHAVEFTPVDASSDAIIKIIKNNPKFTVLHIFNTKIINIPDLLAILKSLDYKIETVDDKTFASTVKKFLKDDSLKSSISGLIPDLNSDKTLSLLSRTLPNGYFTTLYLKSIGYEWPEINKEYIIKYMEYFKKIGYIE